MNNTHIILKRIITIILIVLLLGALIVFLYFYLWFKIGIKNLEKQHDKNIEIELQNRDDNLKIFNEYIKDTYGIVSETFEVEVKSDIVSTDTDFDIKAPFIEKSFRIIVDTDNKIIYKDNFYEVLANDPKFNHLYSDWVKKQIGCEDPNVEMKFHGSTINDPISVNFNQIKFVNNTYDEIFSNIKGYYCIGIKKKNIKNLGTIDTKNIANEMRTKYLIKAIEIIGIPTYEMDAWIELYNNDFLDVSECTYYTYDIKNPNDELKLRNY